MYYQYKVILYKYLIIYYYINKNFNSITYYLKNFMNRNI